MAKISQILAIMLLMFGGWKNEIIRAGMAIPICNIAAWVRGLEWCAADERRTKLYPTNPTRCREINITHMGIYYTRRFTDVII